MTVPKSPVLRYEIKTWGVKAILINGLQMRGRPPKPNAIKRLNGSRHVNNNEPEAPSGAPVCPEHLSETARQHWHRMAAILGEMKILTRADGDALASYCTAYARWVEAEKSINREGTVVYSPKGYPIQNPFLAVANKAMEQMEKIGGRFGLTPSDRARLHVAPDKGEDEMETFLRIAPAAAAG